jgi:peptide/nickel transport system substrate-binding protein
MKRSVCSILAVCLVVVACNGGDSRGAIDDVEVAEEERYGGIAVVGQISDIPDMNPLTSTEHTANQIQQFVLFLPLITYDDRFEPVPRLARSWELNADTTVLTFHLRDDVYWHDGVKTTAWDVKYSYDMATNPETGYPNTAFWTHYEQAEAVDSFTFRIRMRPHAEFLDPWRAFSPVPRHILEGTPPAQIRTHPFGTRNPVGNGPFRFLSRETQQNWVFGANPDFPAELGGRPYLDRIVYRNVPEMTTLLTELLTGNLDYYIQPSPEQAQRIARDGNTHVGSFTDRAFVLIGWNTRRPHFQDVRVRRALTMAMDRPAIIEGVLYGYGEVANSTVPPFYWQHNREAGADLAFDPEASRRLLQEAGWTPGSDGILRNAQGQPFRFTLLTNEGQQVRTDIAAIVQAQLRRVGVDMQIQIQEWGTLLNRINNPRSRDFDAVLIGWVTEFRIDDTNLFHCDKRDQPFQWVGYCDPQVDQLLEILPTIVDRQAALPHWHQYQELIARDQPYTFVYFQERLRGTSRRIRNLEPDARGDWVGAERWYIMPGQRGRGEGERN